MQAHKPPLAAIISVVLYISSPLAAGPDSCPGTWRSLAIPGAAGGIADVLSLPDGTLVVGLKTGGLRLYERHPAGSYVWSSITARAGSIASNKITCLALFLGDLWVGTQDAGISVLSGKNGTWSVFNTSTSSLPSNFIAHLTPVPADPAIAKPSSTDETLWVSTNAGAALYFHTAVPFPRWAWRVIDASDGLPDSNVRDIAVQFREGERYTWIALRESLVRWDGRTFVDYTLDIGGNNTGVETAERLMVDDQNRVWFAAVDVVAGIGPGDGDGGGGGLGATHVPVGLYRLSFGRLGIQIWTKFSQMYAHDMSLDPSGRLWTGSTEHFTRDDAGGGWVHDQGTWCVFKSPDKPITSSNVRSVHAMGELAWFAQDASPTLDSYSSNWSVRSKNTLDITGDAGPVAFGLGTVFVGTHGGISYRRDSVPPGRDNWTFVPLSGAGSPYVTCILPEDNGVWVGLHADGLRFVGIRPSNLTVIGIDEYHAADGLAGEGVQAIARDKGGRLWVGTTQGLSLRGNGYWLNFTQENSPLVESGIRALTVDGEGKLWIGTISAGISILDPEAQGGGAWTSQTTADGLAANAISALLTAPDGIVWAATAAGASEYNPATGQWKVHNAASGALPGNNTRSLAIDSAGRIWVGTTAGLAVREAGVWRHYHVTSSTLGDDVVNHVAAIGTEIWASTQNQIAVREEITGPIGELPPVITSFAPAAAAPGEQVTVTGRNFDARGPGYNQVFVGLAEGSNGQFSQPSEIVSVSATQLVFRVRDLALDGKVRVISNCLEGESAATLKIAPKITSVYPDCLGLGDLVTIYGGGFTVGGGVQVRFGNGPWRNPVSQPGGELRFDVIRLRVQEGDESGSVQVRRQDGLTVTSPLPIAIGHLELVSRQVQQGVEGLRLIWGKRTLVTVDLKAVGCNTKVTGGKLYWKKKDGTRQLGGKAYARWWDQPIAIDVSDPGTNVNHEDFEGLEFIGEFETHRSGFGAFFPLSELAAVECVALNHNVEVLSVEIPASDLNFREIKKKLALISMGVLAEDSPTPWNEFWANATASLFDAARIMPQPDFGPFYGSQAWLDIRSTYITEDSADLDSSLPTSDFARITSRVDGLIEPGFGQFGMALIDPKLYVDEEDDPDPSGKAWVSPGDYDKTAVSFNFKGKAAPIIVQELCHMLGLVDGGAPNHDDDNDGHSLYDECSEYEDDDGNEQCAPVESKTYSRAVLDQKGIEHPRMRQLTDGAPLKIDGGLYSDQRAKSSMSYASGMRNWNSFLEPEDYKNVLAFLTDLYEEWADGGGGGVPGNGTALNLRFLLTMADEVQVTMSYLDDSGEPTTAPEPAGSHHAVVLDAGGALLADVPFTVGFHTHDNEAGSVLLAMRLPFPGGARRAEIRHEDAVLWSAALTPNPPVVAFTAPAGGILSADSVVPVSWTASDPDGGALAFALDYSADGGATWIRLPQNLTGTTFAWRPGFLPKSNAARLRIRATDGFNTTEALSAPFQLTPAQPLVFIRCPEDGASIPEGSLVDLVALSLTSQGAGLGSFQWQVGGKAIAGTASGTEHRFETVGAHVIQVTLTDPSGLTASHQITVQVFPDFDRDGLPNDWEQENGLNPLDLTDASRDGDADGLSNFGEHHWHTDPQDADTDGDGAADGAEVAAGTDPLHAESKPATVPTLHVGASQLGFTVREGGFESEPRSFWVVNQGPGNLTWSLSNGLPWLEASPAGGTAPSEVTLVAMPNGLAVGEYEGQVSFTAPGAQGSPHLLTVRLTVLPPLAESGPQFLRGDSNADGKLNISDASFTLSYLFLDATRAPACLDAADANDDGKVNITDAIFALGGLFLGGPLPPQPFPACGEDPSADGLECGPVEACE